jgi:prepilin-type N-terminal cleavage/methylation domain-containing protein
MTKLNIHQSKVIQKQRGVTLIELMIGIAIIAAIIAGAIMLSSTATTANKVKDATSNVSIIKSAIINLYANEASFDGLSTSVLKSSSGIPAKLKGTNTINSPWGVDSVSISSANSNTQATISYSNVPSDACVDFTKNIYQEFDAVTVGGASVTSVANITTECAKAASQTIVFTINK